MEMAGYRNRMVHFYHEVSADELYQLCAEQLDDVMAAKNVLRNWYNAHQEMVDSTL